MGKKKINRKIGSKGKAIIVDYMTYLSGIYTVIITSTLIIDLPKLHYKYIGNKEACKVCICVKGVSREKEAESSSPIVGIQWIMPELKNQ